MSDYPFDKEKEFRDAGFYAAVPGVYNMPSFPVPRHNTPITPRENFMRIVRGEMPLWVPNLTSDFNFIQPQVMPDASARNQGGVDWFGIEWQFEPKSNAAMVKPGTRRLSDITNWREELTFPNLGDIDWAADYDKNYRDCMSPDRATMFVIVNGLFERLADLMSFTDTLCALLEEPEEVSALFERVTDFHIELMGIAKKYYGADIITFHDDMGTQRSSFFSPDTFNEIMLPQYKRMNAAAHEMGLLVNFHSCGSVANQIDGFIEAGFDFWEGQDACNDKEAIMERTGGKLGQVSFMTVQPTTPEEDVKAEILHRIRTLGKYGRYIVLLRGFDPNKEFRPENYLYEMSRRFYQGEKI